MSKPLGKMGSFVTPFQNFVPLFLLLLLPFSATLCHAQTCPGLTFSSVTPTPWVAGQTYNKVVITGTGLNGPDNSSLCNRFNFGVSLTNGGTATLSDVSYVSAKKITATVTLPASDTAQTACVTADYWEADVIRKTANVRKEASVSSDACAWTSPYFGAIAWFAVPVYPTLTVFHASMYLLWQPDQLSGTGTASIPVPIGHQDWQFVATAVRNAKGKWERNAILTASGDEGDGFEPATPDDNAIYGYPQWTHLVSNDCGVSQGVQQ